MTRTSSASWSSLTARRKSPAATARTTDAEGPSASSEKTAETTTIVSRTTSGVLNSPGGTRVGYDPRGARAPRQDQERVLLWSGPHRGVRGQPRCLRPYELLPRAGDRHREGRVSSASC